MKQNLKIKVSGKVHDVGYRKFIQKHAGRLDIEGTVQNMDNKTVVLFVSGLSEKLDEFIDYLYDGSPKSKVEEVQVEPLFQTKDFRGVFRIIGN